jgi:hypothetical protein
MWQTDKNWVRWLEHAFGGGVQIWVVAQAAGVTNIITLMLLAWLNVAYHGTQIIADHSPDEHVRKYSGLFQLFTFVVKWTAIAIPYFVTVGESPRGVKGAGYYALVPVVFVIAFTQLVYVLRNNMSSDRTSGVMTENVMVLTELVKRNLIVWFFFAYINYTKEDVANFGL